MKATRYTTSTSDAFVIGRRRSASKFALIIHVTAISVIKGKALTHLNVEYP